MKILDIIFRRKKIPDGPQKIVQEINGRKYKITVYRGTIELNDVDKIAEVLEDVFRNGSTGITASAIARETHERLHYPSIGIKSNPNWTVLEYELIL